MYQIGSPPACPIPQYPCIFPIEEGIRERDRSGVDCVTHHSFPRIASVRETGRRFELLTRYPWVVRVCLVLAQLETRLP